MASPQLPFREVDSRFMAKSRQTYANMQARFAEKKSKKGRITRIGREVPFTLPQFRAWLLSWLGTEGGVTQCPYCNQFIDIGTIVVDHAVPVNRGGSLGLDNLVLCDKQCNQEKGQMEAASYRKLREWAEENLPAPCRQDMFQRMSIAVQLAAQQRWQLIQKFKAKRQSPESVEEGEFLK